MVLSYIHSIRWWQQKMDATPMSSHVVLGYLFDKKWLQTLEDKAKGF